MQILIDCHTHIMPKWRLPGMVRWIKRTIPDHPIPEPEEITPDWISKEVERPEVCAFFNYVYPLKANRSRELNHWHRGFCDGRIRGIPFGSFHQEDPDKVKITQECIDDLKMAGMKIHPHVQGFHACEKRLFPVYEILGEMGKPIVIHTGYDRFYQKTMTPEELEGLPRKFPKTPIVFVHAIYPHVKEAFRILETYENIYLDLTNVFRSIKWSLQPETRVKYREVAEEIDTDDFLQKVHEHSNRIMFGTDHPVGLDGPLGVYGDLDMFNLDPNIRKDITYHTARQFIHHFAPQYMEIIETPF
jgi:hypothetical protein